jgi:hypothetical protein
MVFLHAHQAGVAPRRVTLDLDAVADARTVARATTSLTAALLELGWQLPDENVSTDQLGYRFVLRTPGTQSHPAGPDLSFDMLVPEGLGPRTDTTTVPPARAVAIPGASRALARTSRQPVVLGSRHGTVPRPDLLGALVIKSLAAVRDRGTSIDPLVAPSVTSRISRCSTPSCRIRATCAATSPPRTVDSWPLHPSRPGMPSATPTSSRPGLATRRLLLRSPRSPRARHRNAKDGPEGPSFAIGSGGRI